MNARFGFVRVTAAQTRTSLADPEANAEAILEVIARVPESDVVVFPELGITGYTCADLFGQRALLDAAEQAVSGVVAATAGTPRLIVIGAPVPVSNSLYNTAIVIADGRVLGIVPKQFIPNYKEFYERRWFRPADGHEPSEIRYAGQIVPFGIDLLFEAQGGLVVGVEICEDLWMPVPPSSWQAMAGANVLVNLSASNETIGKSRYRTDLVVGQSGRSIAAYAYASAGPSESTTDLVFGGHCLIAENGLLLRESPRVGDGGPLPRDSTWITADVDIQKLQADRCVTTSFDDDPRRRLAYRRMDFPVAESMPGLQRAVAATPFVPRAGAELDRRCAEIFGIQCAGLAAPFRNSARGDASPDRDLGRSRFDAGPAGGRQDVRPAGLAPSPDLGADDAWFRYHRTHPDQRPEPDGPARRRIGDDRHHAPGPGKLQGAESLTLRHRLPQPRRRRFQARARSRSARATARSGVRERPGARCGPSCSCPAAS